MTQKTTDEIRELIRKADLDFETIENDALNAYLHKVFQICPFTEDVCTTHQCMECPIFRNSRKH